MILDASPHIGGLRCIMDVSQKPGMLTQPVGKQIVAQIVHDSVKAHYALITNANIEEHAKDEPQPVFILYDSYQGMKRNTKTFSQLVNRIAKELTGCKAATAPVIISLILSPISTCVEHPTDCRARSETGATSSNGTREHGRPTSAAWHAWRGCSYFTRARTRISGGSRANLHFAAKFWPPSAAAHCLIHIPLYFAFQNQHSHSYTAFIVGSCFI